MSTRTRDLLRTDVVYTDGETSFITCDGLGGVWGEGPDGAKALADEYEAPIVRTTSAHMRRIAEDGEAA